MVIAGINNAQARVAFKNEIADVMKAKGIKATPSFTVLPENMKLKQEQTEEAEMAFIKFLEYEW